MKTNTTKRLLACIFSITMLVVQFNSKASESTNPNQLHQLKAIDFHQGGTSSWKTVHATIESIKLPAPVADCQYAIRFKPHKLGAKLIYQDDFFMTPGMVYQLSFQYKSPNKPASLIFLAANKKHSLSLNPSPNWRQATLDIPLPPNSADGGILQFKYLTYNPGDEMDITAVKLIPKDRGDWLPAKECFERLADYLKPLGWSVSETPEAYILSRGIIRDYFSKKEGLFPRAKWATECYLGRETTDLSYQLKRIPLGYYTYLGRINGEAKRRGIPWKELYEKAFSDLQANNVTTMLIANTGFPVSQKEGFQFILDLAQQKGIQLILQPSSTYFRPFKTKDRKVDIAKTKQKWPRQLAQAKKLFKEFNQHPALLAWCFKEEVFPKNTALLNDYYTQLSEFNTQKPVFICNNRMPSANYPFAPMPQIMAADRYTYKYIPYLALLPTPQQSLITQARALGAFNLAAISSGRPFIHVGLTCNNHCRQLMESAHIIIDPKAGWVKDTEKGWNGTVYYYPPKNGMRAQIWTSIISGSKGFMGWYYTYPAGGKPVTLIPHPRTIDKNSCGISSDRFGNEPPEFAEAGQAFGEIKKLEKYILNMNRRVLPKATLNTKGALLFTHQLRDGKEYILAVANIDLGKPDQKTGYYVDAEEGRMKGMIPAGPKTFEISLKDTSPVYDLKAQKELKVKDGKFSITLEPGEGTLLLLGDKATAEQIQKRFNITQ